MPSRMPRGSRTGRMLRREAASARLSEAAGYGAGRAGRPTRSQRGFGQHGVPKPAQTLVRSIFAQPEQAAVWAQHARIVEQLSERFPDASTVLAEAGPEVLAFASFPKEHWRARSGRATPQERLNREVRRRTDVVGIFPSRAA